MPLSSVVPGYHFRGNLEAAGPHRHARALAESGCTQEALAIGLVVFVLLQAQLALIERIPATIAPWNTITRKARKLIDVPRVELRLSKSSRRGSRSRSVPHRT